MKLLKKLMILLFLELTVLFCVLIFSACESDDNCKECYGCLVEANNNTYCESDYSSVDDFNDDIDELVNGGCTCD